ncbi:hypothetical protein [Citrobacter koseri]|uniref:hypothetical protein n=1 Tax=Citrobacter koseri TaxID=545 RepID=UPI002943EF4B|nr:hypothetical protein [Citrobacter koseri]WOJ04289.1 hypothetical protein R1157_07060 [Citrobacter koseri]
MEEFKGTKGNWSYSKETGTIRGDSGLLAELLINGSEDENGALMAAAPELLEALQLSLTAMNEMGDILNFHDMADAETVERLTPAFEMARSSISKALGKE